MTIIIKSDKFLKVYTNKNSYIFKKACELAYNEIVDGQYGILYDDFNPNLKLKKEWEKEIKNIKIFHVATRGKTLNMDSKISFHKVMHESIYTPESYLKLDEIKDNKSLYFVKSDGGTGGKGVNIYNYESLMKANTNNCVIQKNINNPDLYDNKRYKIRQLVLLHNKNVYIHKYSWFSRSNINYEDISNNNLRKMHVIYQKGDTIFEVNTKLENYELIYNNIKLAVKDFKKYYLNKIDNINDNEFVILGFDFIVDDKKNVQIIEINHRSNYGHPKNVSDICDVEFIKDMIILLINNKTENTNLELIVD